MDEEKISEIYIEMIKVLRNMFIHAKLVHGDFSDYNILYHKGKLYIIDVSQSVEHDHPHALEFLRKDCQNVCDYFQKNGLSSIMTTKELFEFITDVTLKDEEVDQYIEKMNKLCENRILTDEQKMTDEIFKRVYIPRTLGEIQDYEKHSELMKRGDTDKLFYRSFTGMNDSLSGVQKETEFLKKTEEEQKEDEKISLDDEKEEEEEKIEDDKIEQEEEEQENVEEENDEDMEEVDKKLEHFEVIKEERIKLEFLITQKKIKVNFNITTDYNMVRDDYVEPTKDIRGCDLSKIDKKLRKKIVKEFNKERRLFGMTKNEKKVKIKQSKNKKK